MEGVQILAKIDKFEQQEAYSETIEIKSENIDEGVITECASIMLSKGKLVDKATVCGITCNMK